MRKTNKAGIELIKECEGLKLKAYRCPAGVLTIGYGHTAGVKRGDVITAKQAEQFLKDDLAWAEECVEQNVIVAITDNQFSALVSFVYNVGPGAFKKSTLLKLLNQNKTGRASLEFVKWNKAGGVALAGLTKRRIKEMNLFITP